MNKHLFNLIFLLREDYHDSKLAGIADSLLSRLFPQVSSEVEQFLIEMSGEYNAPCQNYRDDRYPPPPFDV